MPSHACRLARVYSSGYSAQSVRLRPFFTLFNNVPNFRHKSETFSICVCVSVSLSLSLSLPTRSSVIEKIKRRQKRETSEEIDSGELGLTNQRLAFNEFNFLSTFFSRSKDFSCFRYFIRAFM